MKATEVTAGLAESNGSLLPGLWRDLLHVTCGLTACTPGSAPGPTLANEYGKTLPFYSMWSPDYVCTPLWSFCTCLSCFFNVFNVFIFYWLFVWLCFFQWYFIDLFSCIAASLFNKLAYLLTYPRPAARWGHWPSCIHYTAWRAYLYLRYIWTFHLAGGGYRPIQIVAIQSTQLSCLFQAVLMLWNGVSLSWCGVM